MAGIPTLYDGAWFRSRIEARHAALFDLLGWPWVYEPSDLKYYIPDFSLTFYKPLLVEVKDEVSTEALLVAAGSKIEASGWKGEVLIVGASPQLELATHWNNENGVFGLLLDVGWDETPQWGNAIFFECVFCKRFSLFHETGSYHCRVCGGWDGDKHLNHPNVSLRTLWNKAGSLVQWKGAFPRKG